VGLTLVYHCHYLHIQWWIRGVSGSKPPLRFQETFLRFNGRCIEINFSKVVPRPFFVVEVLVFRVIEVNCVRLGVLLLAKFNLLCLEMLIKAGCDLFFFIYLFIFFWSSTNSELNFYKTRNLLLKILDPLLIFMPY